MVRVTVVDSWKVLVACSVVDIIKVLLSKGIILGILNITASKVVTREMHLQLLINLVAPQILPIIHLLSMALLSSTDPLLNMEHRQPLTHPTSHKTSPTMPMAPPMVRLQVHNNLLMVQLPNHTTHPPMAEFNTKIPTVADILRSNNIPALQATDSQAGHNTEDLRLQVTCLSRNMDISKVCTMLNILVDCMVLEDRLLYQWELTHSMDSNRDLLPKEGMVLPLQGGMVVNNKDDGNMGCLLVFMENPKSHSLSSLSTHLLRLISTTNNGFLICFDVVRLVKDIEVGFLITSNPYLNTLKHDL